MKTPSRRLAITRSTLTTVVLAVALVAFSSRLFAEPTNEPFEVKARMGPVDDGMVILQVPFTEAFRRAVSRAQHRPMSVIPKSAERRVYLGPDSPRQRQLERWRGRQVIATLVRDSRGFTLLLDVRRAR